MSTSSLSVAKTHLSAVDPDIKERIKSSTLYLDRSDSAISLNVDSLLVCVHLNCRKN